jgi:hypothetical protein
MKIDQCVTGYFTSVPHFSFPLSAWWFFFYRSAETDHPQNKAVCIPLPFERFHLPFQFPFGGQVNSFPDFRLAEADVGGKGAGGRDSADFGKE